MEETTRLQELQERAQRCLCKYCGGELEVRKVFFGDVETARTEIFCKKCDRIEYGVEPEIYSIAKYYVKTFEYNYFPEIDETEQRYRLNVSKINDILSWYSQSIGLVDRNGFRVGIRNDLDKGMFLLAENEILEEC